MTNPLSAVFPELVLFGLAPGLRLKEILRLRREWVTLLS